MNYRSEIDGLRAIAVIPVIFFHAGFSFFSGGYVGVDIFFVISGYLITTIIISELEKEKFQLIKFYERRARRLLPALFFVMFFSLIMAIFTYLPSDLVDFSKLLATVFLFGSNIYLWLGSGYFAIGSDFNPLLHTWSLALEEQFYIFFPLFLILVWRLGLKYVVIYISVICLLSLLVGHWASIYGSHQKIISGAFFLLPTRMWELLIGALVAIYFRYQNIYLSGFKSEIIGLVGLILLFLSIILFDKTIPFPSFYTLIPIVGTVCVILNVNNDSYVNKFLSSKFFVGIGLISYSAYLWHQPIFSFFRVLTDEDLSNVESFFLITLTLFLAYLTWKFVETPFRKPLRFNGKFIFKVSGCCIFIFLCLSLIIIKTDGFSYRSQILLDLREYTAWSPKDNITPDCQELFDTDQYCLIKDPESQPSSVIIGDSHANHFYFGLIDAYSLVGDNLLMIGAGGCPPLLGIKQGFAHRYGIDLRCYERMESIYKGLIEKTKVKRVFISFEEETLLDLNNSPIDVTNEIDFKKNRLEALVDTVTRMQDFFESHGATLIFIEDMPNVSFDIWERCLWQKNSFSRCAGFLEVTGNHRLYQSFLDRLSESGVSILRTSHVLDKVEIFNEEQKKIMYRDGHHLTKLGSKKTIQASYIDSHKSDE